MRKFLAILFTIALLAMVGCKDDQVIVDNTGLQDGIGHNQDAIAVNSALATANEERIGVLELRVTDLEIRLTDDENMFIREIGRIYRAMARGDAFLMDKIRDLKRKVRNNKQNIRELGDDLEYVYEAMLEGDEDLQDQIDRQKRKLNAVIFAEYMESIFLNMRLGYMDYKIGRNERKIRDLKYLFYRTVDNIYDEISRVERDFNDAIDRLETNFNDARDDLQGQIDVLGEDITRVVYPCGEGNSEEVLLDTADGLVGYLQTGHNETINFSVDAVIPAHKSCVNTRSVYIRYYGHVTICNQFQNHPAITISEETTAKFFVLDKAYLDVLSDGNYGTTDGQGCYFSIVDGELAPTI